MTLGPEGYREQGEGSQRLVGNHQGVVDPCLDALHPVLLHGMGVVCQGHGLPALVVFGDAYDTHQNAIPSSMDLHHPSLGDPVEFNGDMPPDTIVVAAQPGYIAQRPILAEVELPQGEGIDLLDAEDLHAERIGATGWSPHPVGFLPAHKQAPIGDDDLGSRSPGLPPQGLHASP